MKQLVEVSQRPKHRTLHFPVSALHISANFSQLVERRYRQLQPLGPKRRADSAHHEFYQKPHSPFLQLGEQLTLVPVHGNMQGHIGAV